MPYFTFNLLPFVAAIACSFAISHYAFNRGRIIGAATFGVYALLQGINLTLQTLEMVGTTLDEKLWWDQLQWFPSILIGIALTMFVRQFTGRSIRDCYTMLLFPALFGAALLIDPIRSQIYTDPRLIPNPPFDSLMYTFTPPMWLAVGFFYNLVAYAIYRLVSDARQAHGIQRRQLLLIAFGVGVPGLLGLINLFTGWWTLFGQRDLSAIWFTLSNCIIAYGLFRYRMFDPTPQARITLLENSADGVIVLDRHNHIVEANRRARAYLGSESVYGRPLIEVSADCARFLTYLPREHAAEIEARTGEPGAAAADGTRIEYVAVQSEPLYDPTGAFGGRLVIIRDITRRKLLEQDGIERERLRVAVAKQQELNDFKTKMMVRISHEFRTPLSVILSSSEMLDRYLDKLPPEKRREKVGQIRAQVDHLSEMLDEIAYLVRGQFTSAQHTLQLVDLGRISADVADEMQTFGIVPQRIHRALEPVELLGEAKTLRMLLRNLFTNAAKYSPPDSVISIRTWRDSQCGWLQITDQGIGMTPEDQARIFDPFFRGANSSEKEGLGLGMSIVQDVVRQHDGTIQVTSALHHGTTITISLPRYDALRALAALPEALPQPLSAP